ncbi:MAG: outer membrane protein assembly factor BamD [Chitinophagales bacterium]
MFSYLCPLMKSRLRFSLFPLLAFILITTSCSQYQQVVKSDDYYLKLAKAKEYFEKGQYYRAQPLLEELLTFFKGTNVMQDVLYYYAYCHYETGEYLIAAYHFKNYAGTYPNDPRAEECLFMSAKCYYEVSPSYMLEQSYTNQCIDALQLFINTYPNSHYVDDANKMVDDMRGKLEQKAFYSANLYYRMGKYKAANVAFQNLLRDYPESKDAEYVMFLMLKADYLYAINSITSKQEERFQTTISTYQNFTNKYTNSEYLGQAKSIYEASVKNMNKLKTNEQE